MYYHYALSGTVRDEGQVLKGILLPMKIFETVLPVNVSVQYEDGEYKGGVQVDIETDENTYFITIHNTEKWLRKEDPIAKFSISKADTHGLCVAPMILGVAKTLAKKVALDAHIHDRFRAWVAAQVDLCPVRAAVELIVEYGGGSTGYAGWTFCQTLLEHEPPKDEEVKAFILEKYNLYHKNYPAARIGPFTNVAHGWQ